MNGAMETVTGRLIEMNSQMVVTDTAFTLIGVGLALAALFLIGAFAGWLNNAKRWWLCFIGVFVFAALVVVGFRMPRVKEIHACADGPISLELIASRYDVVEINGKELRLRVR